MHRGDVCRYIGVDESNHGRSPEIFVAVYSSHRSDISIQTSKLHPKKRTGHRYLASRLGNRAYSFLIVDRDVLHSTPEDIIVASVVSSFIGEARKDFALEVPFYFFIDGDISDKREREIRSRCEKDFGITCKEMHLSYGKDLDRKTFLVNLADEIAHTLYRKTLEKLVEHPRRVKLQLP